MGRFFASTSEHTQTQRFSETVNLNESRGFNASTSNTGLARGESVLSTHGLALVDPRAIEVATPKRVRRRLPSWVEPVSAPKGERTTSYEGIPSQRVADAIECCAGPAMPARLLEAAKQARGEGLVTTSEYNRLEREPS